MSVPRGILGLGSPTLKVLHHGKAQVCATDQYEADEAVKLRDRKALVRFEDFAHTGEGDRLGRHSELALPIRRAQTCDQR